MIGAESGANKEKEYSEAEQRVPHFPMRAPFP